MPIYCYSCVCSHSWEERLNMPEMTMPLGNPCPFCGKTGSVKQELTTASFGDPVSMGHTRVPAGFTQVLDRIHAKSGKKGPRVSKFAETREV